MAVVALGEAAIFNPQVKLAKGVIAPYVAMETLQPFTRDVYKTENKEYRGGTKFLDGDILMARITPSLENGKTSIYRGGEDSSKAAFGSTEFIVIRGVKGKALTDFLYYLFTSTEIRDVAIASMTGSSGRQRVQNDVLKNYRVKLPTLKEQQTIAATLGALDDKIESNQSISMKANFLADAEIEKILNTVDLRTGLLEEFVTFNANSVKPGDTEKLLYIDIASVSPGRVDGVQELSWENAPSRARRKVADGDVIFSTVRPGRRSFALLLDPDPLAVASTGFAVITPRYPFGSSFLTYVAASKSFSEYLQNSASGSAYPAVSITAMGKYEFAVPENEDLLALIESQTMPLRRIAAQKISENRVLASLRDTLLPELISGRIRVPEARQAVEDAIDSELPEVRDV